MAKWLVPWVVPAVLVAVVVIAALIGTLGVTGSTVGTGLLVVVVAGGLIRLRLRDLKMHPPDPELVRKPFWKF
jgi:hypothetical protein